MASTFLLDSCVSCITYYVLWSPERTWFEQGHKVGEEVVPLARSFDSTSIDVESGGNNMVCKHHLKYQSTNIQVLYFSTLLL